MSISFGNTSTGAAPTRVARRTLAKATPPLAGVGLHTGEQVALQMFPAEGGRGIVFRSALSRQEIAVIPSNVHSTVRCTAVAANSVVLQTVEHVLSALAGCGVTDAELVCDGPEIPLLDGSAAPFAAALQEAGIVDAGGDVETVRLDAPVTVCGDGGSAITAVPSDRLSICVVLEYPDKPLMAPQAAVYHGVGYAAEIAPARTYGFVSELAYLAERGLARGATRENAFALNDDGSPEETTPLRFANEAARHKLLDVIGDLMFAGGPVCAGIIALRPSHTLNARLASELYAAGRACNK